MTTQMTTTASSQPTQPPDPQQWHANASAAPIGPNINPASHTQLQMQPTNRQPSRMNSSRKTVHVAAWWKIRLFRGMVNDVRRRAPYYVSDWTDAWDYRVVPATVYMYFAK